ncbi:hypothetical protein JW758_06435 [Candidatus Peregrinibacteria bacterium]|nr:hypothetical protein [Candidatus Peregrinibacteria bacterium]
MREDLKFTVISNQNPEGILYGTKGMTANADHLEFVVKRADTPGHAGVMKWKIIGLANTNRTLLQEVITESGLKIVS